ncbi:MAG: hypothetical protein QOI64_2836 [Solirubrobacteraceae bacterium]|nr:hypothetical protein [Solirubrobacteraceae bacterium]
MHVIAALADAPTAAIAVVAIVLGLLLAARGPREKRAAAAANGAEESGPAMVTLPTATATAPATEAEPGFVGPAGEVVGHGPIRLGIHGPPAGESAAPAAAPAPAPAVDAPAPAEPSLPVPAPAPAPVAEAPEPPAQEPEEPAAHKEPGWRGAARAANSAVRFRQGAIKIGGKAAGRRKDR